MFNTDRYEGLMLSVQKAAVNNSVKFCNSACATRAHTRRDELRGVFNFACELALIFLTSTVPVGLTFPT
jgi:hypothetical protein